MGDIALTVSSVMRGIVGLGSLLETSEMVVKEGYLKGNL
ncbi:hypothetical protein Krac_4330 [Ktedonobacter racemifer DSM 44963]|uniref:Uncharacterized protein n=2 Tax=Ktedonobacter racemifer TaxID=363277 RepID=D6TSH3_KTERA|nr:hypothetical protein Krac_4330 [Ktedonobacter racemifer DSM 44963]